MKIFCQERYDEAMKYATETNDPTLQRCLDKLKGWETSNPEYPCEIELHYDFAPLSFLFVQRYPDGRSGIVGGLVYHGSPDESMCVQLTPTKGWQTHT